MIKEFFQQVRKEVEEEERKNMDFTERAIRDHDERQKRESHRDIMQRHRVQLKKLKQQTLSTIEPAAAGVPRHVISKEFRMKAHQGPIQLNYSSGEE